MVTLQALLGGHAMAPAWGSQTAAAASAASVAAREVSPTTDGLSRSWSTP